MSITDDYVNDIRGLHQKFNSVQGANHEKGLYYDGLQRIKDLGISLPPQMRSIEAVVGWPGTAVDVVEERLDFEGWTEGELDEVYTSNDLDVEAPQAHLDSLIYGTSFIAVTSGSEGEPDPLVTVESPTSMTAEWDGRKRAIKSAAKFWKSDDGFDVDRAVLFRPNENVVLEKSGTRWVTVDVDEHNSNRVSVAQMVNRPRASKRGGRSEITPAVRGYTDMALRTLVGAEVAREFYAVPQRYLMGAPDEFFFDENGDPRGAWDAMAGKILAISADPETGDVPQVGSFAANSMTPFFEQIRNLAQMLSSETAIPPMYLGFATDQASSADAIRAMESRLVKRAERRQSMFGKAWTEAGRLALMMRDGVSWEDLPPEYLSIRPMWRDPATPTKAAAADAAVKLVGAGVYTSRGEMTVRSLNLTATERELLKSDWAKDTTGALERLTAAQASPEAAALVYGTGDTPNGSKAVTGDSGADSGDSDKSNPDEDAAKVIKAKADAMGVLIRAGVTSDSAAKQVGLSGLSFHAGRPTTLKYADEE